VTSKIGVIVRPILVMGVLSLLSNAAFANQGTDVDGREYSKWHVVGPVAQQLVAALKADGAYSVSATWVGGGKVYPSFTTATYYESNFRVSFLSQADLFHRHLINGPNTLGSALEQACQSKNGRWVGATCYVSLYPIFFTVIQDPAQVGGSCPGTFLCYDVAIAEIRSPDMGGRSEFMQRIHLLGYRTDEERSVEAQQLAEQQRVRKNEVLAQAQARTARLKAERPMKGEIGAKICQTSSSNIPFGSGRTLVGFVEARSSDNGKVQIRIVSVNGFTPGGPTAEIAWDDPDNWSLCD